VPIGEPGEQGESGIGIPGPTSVAPPQGNSTYYKFSSSTEESDPTDGYFRFDEEDFDDVTEFYISNNDAYVHDMQNWLNSLLDGGKPGGNRSIIQFVDRDDPSNVLVAYVTGLLSSTNYKKIYKLSFCN